MIVLIQFSKYFILNLSFVFFLSCAAVMAPPGGPIDDIPPELIEVNPPNGTVNFNSKTVELNFSEYLNENTIEQSFDILPILAKKPVITYKGKRVIIEFSDSLLLNQTYIIVINRNLSDEHNVKISQGIQVAFSTGPIIDKGLISGKVYHAKESSLLLWKIQNSTDSLSFFNRLPDYIIDANDDGYYEFKFLSPGNYRILALDRKMSRLPFIPNKMVHGMSWFPVIDIKNGQNKTDVNIKIPDRLGAVRMIGVEPVKESWGSINFSDDINEIENKLLFSFSDDSSLALDADVFSDPLSSNKINFNIRNLKDDNIIIKAKKLLDGSKILMDSGSVKIRMDTKPDTNYLSILQPKANYNHFIESDNIKPLKIVFSSLIEINSVLNVFSLSKDSLSIPIEYEQETPLLVNIIPKDNWSPKSTYTLKISNKGINPFFGKALKDSIVSIDFRTNDFTGFGSLILNLPDYIPHILTAELTEMKKEHSVLGTYVISDGKINIQRIPEGNYSLMLFKDKDNNKKYSPGQIQPYFSSEWFYNYPDTIKIRSNWEIQMDNIILDLDN
tara:strand:+ start:1148 stop:2818 length:1671 start_codon:yes stop_codon:yes gene_type:complete